MEEMNNMEKSIRALYSLLWSAFGLIALTMVCLVLTIAVLHAKGIC